MAQEHIQKAPRPRPEAEFGLTEQERQRGRVNQERLWGFLDDEATTVHRIEESYNNYGEFAFVTLSRPGQGRRVLITFWGAGYHEYRERWLMEEWHWHLSNPYPEWMEQDISRDEAKAQLQERLAAIRPDVNQAMPTKQGKLFELLADLTDEDAAYIEMQDLDDLGSLLDEV